MPTRPRTTPAALLALLAQPLLAQSVHYDLRIDNPASQTCTVTMTATGLEGPSVQCHLPTWRPGKYLILDQASTIRRVWRPDTTDPNAITKTAKSTWTLDTLGSDSVSIACEIYANSLHDRTRHIDDTHAFLDGSAVFMFIEQLRNAPVTVRVHAPDGWDIATSLDHASDDPTLLSAPDYDTLVDSPLEIGLHRSFGFDVQGVPHRVVIWGQADCDPDRLSQDLAAIVSHQAAIFGDIPYPRYLYIIHAADGIAGGTEHLNSTVMQTSPRFAQSEDDYRRFLGLASHEMFHTWNVKRLRPAGLVPYDYLKENYTDLLWVAEGTTSYYDDLTLARAGLIDPDRYFKTLADSYASFLSQPGRNVQSLADSSFDAWIKFNRSWPDKHNATISFYSKGALVSLLLDLDIRAKTASKRSLDDVLRSLYEQHPLSAGGFTTDDLKRTIEQTAGAPFDSFFDAFVTGTAPLPLADAFNTVGLVLRQTPDDDGPEFRLSLGLRLTRDDGAARVTAIDADGPAAKAGLMVGDRLIALNDRRLLPDNLDDLLEDCRPGSQITLTLFRRDQLLQLPCTPDALPNATWTLKRTDDPTPQQKEAYHAWLHQPWPERS